MGKNKKTETIVAVLIPVLVFLLMAALTVVLWDAHNPSGARSAGASTETGTVQPGIAKEGEDLEAQTEKPAVNPILVIEDEKPERYRSRGYWGEDTGRAPERDPEHAVEAEDRRMNIFEILGPVMVGPSSSHTAGAVRIGLMTRRLLGQKPVKARIGMYGSFLATGRGHGTDRAVVAGLLGMKPDDIRIPESFELAAADGLSFSFEEANLSGAHPNTVLLEVEGDGGRELSVQASSLGGGRIMVNRLDGIDVNCTCEMPTLIVHNMDQPGHVAEVTSMLSHKSVNIANMSLYRDKRGGRAVMVVETDQPIPEEALRWLEHLEGILKVTYINVGGEI